MTLGKEREKPAKAKTSNEQRTVPRFFWCSGSDKVAFHYTEFHTVSDL